MAMYSRVKNSLFPFFLFLFSFLLSTQLGRHFFFPFSYIFGIRVDYLAPTIYVTDILSILLLLVWLVQSINRLNSLKKTIQRRSFLFLLAIIFLVINYSFSLSKPLWIYHLFRSLQLVLLFFFFRQYGKKKNVYSTVVGGLFVGSLFELTLSLLQLSLRRSLQHIWYFFGERRFSILTPGIAKARLFGVEFLRPYGTFSHPNSLAGFYLLLYTFVLTQKKITNMWFKICFLFFSSALIIISFSRAILVIFILINLLYFFSQKIDCRPCTISKIVLSLFLLFLVFNTTGDPQSLQKRIDFFGNSLHLIQQKPITGVGIGSYLIAQQVFPERYPIFFEQPVHNIFFLLMAELGLPLTLILFYSIYRLVPRSPKDEVGYSEPFIRKSYFFLPFLCVLLTGSVDHYWVTLQQNVLLLAVIFGILFSS